jgi:hypothetical protein
MQDYRLDAIERPAVRAETHVAQSVYRTRFKCTWMPPKLGACTVLAFDDFDPPCNPSGPDRISSISVDMVVVSEMPFGLITHRFVSPACGEAGGGTVTNRQLKLPAASFSMVKSPMELADVPTVCTLPSHCPIAHSAPGSKWASPKGLAAGCWAEDCVADSASVATPITEATNIRASLGVPVHPSGTGIQPLIAINQRQVRDAFAVRERKSFNGANQRAVVAPLTVEG